MPLLWIALTLLALALVLFWIEPPILLPLLEKLTPNLTYRVPTSHPLVALSFDDGPHPIFTPQVLDILRQHNAHATFFLIGERALRHPDLVARIRAEAHEVANHYFTDGSILFLRGSKLQLRQSAIHQVGLQPLKKVFDAGADFLCNLEQTEKALGITSTPKFFRPPGGVARPSQLRLAQSHGYECVLGSAYPHDPLHPPARYIRWLVTKNLAPGAIVILHDGISNPTRTIQALPQILAAAHRKGFRVVSIGALRSAAKHPAAT
jgi:peptidoglycan/xylan/chitin deacetylase (PgdA/CDA1 family)